MKAKKGESEGVTDFDWSSMGDCGYSGDNLDAQTFGWDTPTPCIYLRLNRIIDWKPVGLFKPADGSIFANDGPKKPMVEDAVYMRCKSKYIGDKEADAAPSALTFTYFGGNGDGYVEKKFFPYGGKAAQPNYHRLLSPSRSTDSRMATNIESPVRHMRPTSSSTPEIILDTLHSRFNTREKRSRRNKQILFNPRAHHSKF